jgi:glycosyltransferase involved in cell wall biosynthesis
VSGERLVSVIIPVYNGRTYVERALDSVLSQSHPAVEALVVDDGSTDGTGELLAARATHDARVRVVTRPNGGLAAARNTGLEHARGDYLAFLDADDWLLPHKLELQLDVLQAHPDAGLVYSDYERFDERDGVTYAVPRGVPPRPFPEMLVYRNWFAVMVPLLRRSLVERVGVFDTAFHAAEDWDYWYRCAQQASFVYAPGVVAVYRQHGGQMHRDYRRMITARRQFARKHFAGDPVRMRRCMSYYHLEDAKYWKGEGRWLACGASLARYLGAARSVREARFVWGLP